MKKLLLLTLITICSLSAQAQLVSSSSRVITTTVERPKIESYFRVGLINSNSFIYGLNKNIFYSEDIYGGLETGLTNDTYTYIDIHPSIGYKHNLSERVELDAHLGLRYSIVADRTYHYYEEPNEVGGVITCGVGLWIDDRFNVDLRTNNNFSHFAIYLGHKLKFESQKTTVEKTEIESYIRVGYGHYSYNEYARQNLYGFTYGLNKYIFNQDNIYGSLEAGFRLNKYKWKRYYYSDSYLDINIHPSIGYKYTLSKRVELDAHLGLTYVIVTEEDYSVGTVGEGVTYGLGIWLDDKFNVDLRANNGFSCFTICLGRKIQFKSQKVKTIHN